MDNAPIIILGSPRSGTTFLGNFLKNNSTLCYAEEFRFTWLYSNEKAADMLRPVHATSVAKKYIREKFTSTVLKAGKERLLEKTPSNSLRPFFVDQIFPNAKYLYIHRDPVECILSIRDLWSSTSGKLTSIGKKNHLRRLKDMHISQYKYILPELIRRLSPDCFFKRENLWGPRFPGMADALSHMGLLETCCMQWRFCFDELENFYDNGPKERIFKLKLEDLNSETMSEIIKFCDLNEEGLLELFKNEYTKNPSGLRNQFLESSEKEIIRRWTKV